jgi:hypothetical protein
MSRYGCAGIGGHPGARRSASSEFNARTAGRVNHLGYEVWLSLAQPVYHLDKA